MLRPKQTKQAEIAKHGSNGMSKHAIIQHSIYLTNAFLVSQPHSKRRNKLRLYYETIFQLSDWQNFTSLIAQSAGQAVGKGVPIHSRWKCQQGQFCNICTSTLEFSPIALLALTQNNIYQWNCSWQCCAYSKRPEQLNAHQNKLVK